MTLLEVKRIKGTIVTVGIQKNPASLDIALDAVVPPEYMVPQPAKVDKKSLLAAVKVSVTIKGQTERGTRIAQGVIAPVKTASFVEVDGQRGENGFGSIGVK